jgi:hypothetical protein
VVAKLRPPNRRPGTAQTFVDEEVVQTAAAAAKATTHDGKGFEAAFTAAENTSTRTGSFMADRRLNLPDSSRTILKRA